MTARSQEEGTAMAKPTRFAVSAGLAAAFSMAAVPASAASLPAGTSHADVMTPGVFDADSVNAQDHRWYRYRRHNHVDAGDVIAGVLILGTIAAIASSASKAERERREDYRDRDYRREDYRDRPYDYRERRGDSRYDGGRGIDNAVNMCVSQIERDVRVDSVDGVDRTGEGWRVSGKLYNGEGFTCEIDADGRVRGVEYGVSAVSSAEDNQLSDDRYEAAWGKVARDGSGRAVTAPSASQPAYPGGPIDGDLSSDGRYEAEPQPGG